MNKSATVQAQVDLALKKEVDLILGQLGLTGSDAIHLLYRQICLRRGLPFDVVIPNEATARTLRESRTGTNVKHFSSKERLFDDLGL